MVKSYSVRSKKLEDILSFLEEINVKGSSKSNILSSALEIASTDQINWKEISQKKFSPTKHTEFTLPEFTQFSVESEQFESIREDLKTAYGVNKIYTHFVIKLLLTLYIVNEKLDSQVTAKKSNISIDFESDEGQKIVEIIRTIGKGELRYFSDIADVVLGDAALAAHVGLFIQENRALMEDDMPYWRVCNKPKSNSYSGHPVADPIVIAKLIEDGFEVDYGKIK
jgi:alkylated DNA nucleotide flippase Atl1